MKNLMKNKLLMLAVAGLALSGCQTQAEITAMNAAAKPPSAATKRAIIQAARDYLKDPYSIRDAEISGEITLNAKTNTTAVCVAYNSKNGFGAYAGRSITAVRLVNSVPVAAFEGQDAACRHPALKWYPFPEIRQLTSL